MTKNQCITRRCTRLLIQTFSMIFFKNIVRTASHQVFFLGRKIYQFSYSVIKLILFNLFSYFDFASILKLIWPVYHAKHICSHSVFYQCLKKRVSIWKKKKRLENPEKILVKHFFHFYLTISHRPFRLVRFSAKLVYNKYKKNRKIVKMTIRKKFFISSNKWSHLNLTICVLLDFILL